MKKTLILFLAVIICGYAAAQPSRIKTASQFLDYLNTKDYDAAAKLFDATVSKQLSGAKLGEVWEKLNSQVGPFQKVANISAEGPVIVQSCVFEKANLDLRLTFDSSEHISGIFFVPSKPSKTEKAYKAPSYADPALFTEREIKIGSGKYVLPGTLTLPASTSKAALVILVHGSGPNDRDETIGPNKPFADLAQGFASKGIAVLRYEKRSLTYGAEMAMERQLTVQQEVMQDVQIAIEAARQLPEINPQKIYVLGHSLGGLLAPRIAAGNPGLAGIIMAGAPARPLEDLMIEQTEYLLSLEKMPETEKEKKIAEVKTEAAKIKSSDLPAHASAGDLIFGVPASYWLDLRSYDPLAITAKLNLPVLILQGERDYQVTMQDFKLWKEKLGNKEQVSLKSYPDLNHLFMSGKGKSAPAEYKEQGTVSEQVIHDVVAFINGTHKVTGR